MLCSAGEEWRDDFRPERFVDAKTKAVFPSSQLSIALKKASGLLESEKSLSFLSRNLLEDLVGDLQKFY